MLLIKLVILSLCYLSTVFRNITLGIRVWYREAVPLVESDVKSSSVIKKSPVPAEQLKDMISFDECTDASEVTSCSRMEGEMKDASIRGRGKIEDMIRANLTDFTQGQMVGPTLCGSALVKRRPRELDGL